MQTHLDAIIADSPRLLGSDLGPLDGIEAVVKDCFAVAGHTSSFGLARWRETHDAATRHSAVVSRLLESGADIVGLTELDQLTFSLVGDVSESGAPRNPRFPELFCGGSSSGSAAAVAGGIASLGVGTDTAGSIRVPAAMCGIHALRPSWGLIDNTGCLALAPSFDTVGLLAANPAVMRRTLGVLGHRRWHHEPLRRVLVDPSLAELTFAGSAGTWNPSVATAVASALSTKVEAVSLSHLFNHEVGALFSRLQGREVWMTLGKWASEHTEAIDVGVARRLAACHGFARENAATIEVDLSDRRRFKELLAEVVEPGCVLVTPVLGAPGPRLDDGPEVFARFRRNTIAAMAPASLAGWPQVTWSRKGPKQPHLDSVALLAGPGSDHALVELLCRLWQQDVTDSAGR